MEKEIIMESRMRMVFSENLCYLRKTRKQKISQKALARYLSLPSKTIMNYESGNASLSAYAVYRLADYYGYSMEEILTKNLSEERRNER